MKNGRSAGSTSTARKKSGDCQSSESLLLKALATALLGERRHSLDEANALGYFTTAQIARQSNLCVERVQRFIKLHRDDFERIRLTGNGGPMAYRLKKKIALPKKSS